MNEPPTDIRSVRPDVPDGLVSFLEKAMAKNPDERFQTGEEFAQALRAALAGGPAPAAAASTGIKSVDIEL